jgi:hypothetical protein
MDMQEYEMADPGWVPSETGLQGRTSSGLAPGPEAYRHPRSMKSLGVALVLVVAAIMLGLVLGWMVTP